MIEQEENMYRFRISAANCLIACAGHGLAAANEWRKIGPEGGSALFVVVDSRNSSTLYAATAVGVFKSVDRGATWSNAGLMGYKET